MKVGKIIGSVWATQKETRLSGLKLLLVQPMLSAEKSPEAVPFVAADMVGAGIGEWVIVVSGSSARSAAGDNNTPIDASIVGIIDDMDVDAACWKEKMHGFTGKN
ncbi:EutN/CcmL family microcompartment protein [Pseudoramibacter faecis]|uniref:EutN/CcmL family microcompartment protein n=1 Tax=Pseudoramibacter faecis TaxID=3108534 RepID=UPI002E778AE6|nr:EutN/CcmL family microcompartment protein [Pseudoramibacter sp. HA2172]